MSSHKYNNQPEALAAGIYRFRFYRMGEWMDIIIDDQLPKKFHAKVKNNEYWVPLVEKAYAKFFGYDKNKKILLMFLQDLFSTQFKVLSNANWRRTLLGPL